jgi:hypothetical protein
MLIAMAVGLTAVWVGACLLRRRHLRNKGKEIELQLPPVAWGPRGYTYGDGVLDASQGVAVKELRSQIADVTPPDAKRTRESRSWLTRGNR